MPLALEAERRFVSEIHAGNEGRAGARARQNPDWGQIAKVGVHAAELCERAAGAGKIDAFGFSFDTPSPEPTS